MQQASLNATDRVGVMMKTGKEREECYAAGSEEKNLNWPVERSWRADEERWGRTKSTEYVGQVSLKVPVTLERLQCVPCLLSQGTYTLNEL